MWVEALDLLCQRMKDDGVALSDIRAISGSGQQHGTVYWSAAAESALSSYDASKSLLDALSPAAFAYDMSPNWQDASTAAECAALEDVAGGPEELAKITGSRAHHRFSGPQIMRLRKQQSDVYNATKHISLVSSFVCSLLLGRLAPVDPADVCGMNLWDVQREAWDESLLAAVAGGTGAELDALREKLPSVCMDGAKRQGDVARYFVDKYGFSPSCGVYSFTGDNPATILSLPLRERDAMISLGTSTTLLLATKHYRPSAAYHLFAHPTTKGAHMAMLCYKNGSLAREAVRRRVDDAAVGGDAFAEPRDEQEDAAWARFNRLTEVGTVDSAGDAHQVEHAGKKSWPRKMAFFFELDEIIPPAQKGVYRFVVDGPESRPRYIPSDAEECNRVDGTKGGEVDHTEWNDPRLILESQFLDIRMRSAPFFKTPPRASRADVQELESEYELGSDATPSPSTAAAASGHETNPEDASGVASGVASGGASGGAGGGTEKMPTQQPRRVYVVGGAAKNRSIVRHIGRCIGGAAGVWRQTGAANACALGGASKAAWAVLRRQPHSTNDNNDDHNGTRKAGSGGESGTGSEGETFENFVARTWKPEEVVTKVDDGYTAEPWAYYGASLGAVADAEDQICSGDLYTGD